MTRVLLSSADVIRHAGITYRQLNHWTVRGLLRPEERQRNRPGVDREWSRAEADMARVIGRLTDAGLTLDVAAKVARSGQPRYEIGPGVWIEVNP
jgi:DNA-binding transcriptional MerR regulator